VNISNFHIEKNNNPFFPAKENQVEKKEDPFSYFHKGSNNFMAMLQTGFEASQTAAVFNPPSKDITLEANAASDTSYQKNNSETEVVASTQEKEIKKDSDKISNTDNFNKAAQKAATLKDDQIQRSAVKVDSNNDQNSDSKKETIDQIKNKLQLLAGRESKELSSKQIKDHSLFSADKTTISLNNLTEQELKKIDHALKEKTTSEKTDKKLIQKSFENNLQQQSFKFEENSNDKEKIQVNGKYKKQTQPVADINTAIKQTEVVSRETIKSTELKNDFDKIKEQHTSGRSGQTPVLEKNAISSTMKQSLDSDMMQNNQGNNQSTSFQRLFSSESVKDNPTYRTNMQQQIDQMFQRTRVMVKENGNATLSTRLYPEELGKISIRLSLIEGQLKGFFTVENETVQKELHVKMERLLENLRQDGFEIGEFQIDIDSRESSSNTEQSSLAGERFGEKLFDNSKSTITSDSIISKDKQTTGGIYA